MIRYSKQHHYPKSNPACDVCGHVWNQEDFAAIKQHMVDMHGYKKEGNQVFKSVSCAACAKPGLYRIGKDVYCKEHVSIGQPRLNWRTKILDQKMAAVDSEFERRMKQKDSAHRVAQLHHSR
jgi:hypothetical protein